MPRLHRIPLSSAVRSVAFCAIVLAGLVPHAGTAVGKELLTVSVDHARVLKIDRAAETVIIGNPSIVDVTVHDSSTLVLTGRSYGITNLVILDGDGEAILDEEVSVQSHEAGTVRVFRQSSRTTYACSTVCEPTVTIGDNSSSFGLAAEQFSTRQSMSTGVAK